MKSCPEVGTVCHFSLTGHGEICGHLMVPEHQESPGAGCQDCEPPCADPRALGREIPLSPHRAKDTGQSVVRVKLSVPEQMFCKLQLPYK